MIDDEETRSEDGARLAFLASQKHVTIYRYEFGGSFNVSCGEDREVVGDTLREAIDSLRGQE